MQTSNPLLARNFYLASEAAPLLMRVAHFPDEIFSFLQLESLVAFNALSRYQCDAIVEFGCYDGRAFEISRLAGINYLGVDLNPTAVNGLQSRIAVEGCTARACAIVADALNPSEWRPYVRGQ